MASSQALNPQAMWKQTVDTVKKQIMQPSLWQALEATNVIALEGDLLVLGLPVAASLYRGHITSADIRNRIQNILSELAGRPITFLVIEGTEAADWELLKQREAIAEAAQEAQRAKVAHAEALEASWDSLADAVYEAYSRFPFKQMPHMRARFIREVVPMISDAMDRLMVGPDADHERNHRGLARVLDRVGTLANVPGTVVALHVEEYRQRRA